MSVLEYLWRAEIIRRSAIPVTGGAICLALATWFLLATLNEDPARAIVIIGVVWIVVLLALFTGVGRTYAVGFVTAIIVGSLMTSGLLLKVWGMPLIAAYHAVDGASASRAEAASRAALEHTRTLSRREWVNARRAEPPILAHGQILANTVNECATAYRAIDSLGSYPRNVDELEMVNCSELAITSADTSFSHYIENDRGWRWTYRPGAPDSTGRTSTYYVRVFEDPAIERQSPQYVTDATGAVRELSAGKPPALVANPVKVLQQLYRCVQAVPEQRAADSYTQRAYTHFDGPFDEVMHRCEGLRGPVTFPNLQNKYGVITLSVRRSNGNEADTVGVFNVALLPVDERRFIFELRATPIGPTRFHSGSRHYFVALDGSIHARNGEAASIADPTVSAAF